MRFIGYIVATFVGLAISYASIIFALLSGPKFAYMVGGFLFITHIASFVFAYKKIASGNADVATIGLVSPPFILYFVMLVLLIAYYLVLFINPNSSEFDADCQTSGAQYFMSPENPVHSIAFDWEEKYGPETGLYNLWFNGRIIISTGGLDKPIPLYDKAIKFTERRVVSKQEELSPHPYAPRRLPFVRFTKSEKPIEVESLDADVVVTYQFIHQEERSKAEVDRGSVGYDLTVTDRRNGQKIAAMRYFVDRKNDRICGPITNNVLSEKEFLAKALGLNG